MNKLSLALLVLLQGCGCTQVNPGERGVKVYFGEVEQVVHPEGLVWHAPFITHVERINIQQQTWTMKSECYSSDLQQIDANVKVLFRVPESQVIVAFQKYFSGPGGMMDAVVSPRTNEALKEVTAQMTAENIVKNRELVKGKTLSLTRQKVGDIVVIDDIVIDNLTLSKQLEDAIESKMVQQQEAAKAEFTRQKAKVEAETAVIKAQGEADAIKIRGSAIRDNPKLIDLQIAEKWNGVAPLVVGGNNANILLPVGHEATK